MDDALSVAENYALIMQMPKEINQLYKNAEQNKKDHFEKYKKFSSIKNVMLVVDKYHNSLLNESAVRYLYKENSFDNAIKLLQTKMFDNDEFRIIAFASIYTYLGEKDKLYKLKKLVEKNSTYSQKIKNIIKDM